MLTMAREGRLIEIEKATISGFNESGIFNRQIAKNITRFGAVIDNFVRLAALYATKEAKAVQKIYHVKEIKFMQKLEVPNKLLARQIKNKLLLPVTTGQVQKILHQSPTIKFTKRLKKPELTRIHKENRLKFTGDDI